jgi:hypothetical protein
LNPPNLMTTFWCSAKMALRSSTSRLAIPWALWSASEWY